MQIFQTPNFLVNITEYRHATNKMKKKTITQVEKFKYISILKTRGSTETNDIKRVFKTT